MAIPERAEGVFAIAPTPFSDSGAIDYGSIGRLADFYTEIGCSGITVLGVMGEAQKLDVEESASVAGEFIQRARGLPVIVGVSASNLATVRDLTKRVMNVGAAGVMIAPVPFLRTDDQIVAYFKQAVDAIGPEVPFVLQDYPPASNVVMAPRVIRQIIRDHLSCAILKHEDWPGLEKISVLRSYEKDGSMRRVPILCGNGGLFLDFELERGADGAMTGYAFLDMLCEVIRLTKANDRAAAHDLFDHHLPLLRYEQQVGVGLGVRKYILRERGIIASDAQRAPVTPLSGKAGEEVKFLLKRLARFDRRAGKFA